jgi:transposase
MKKPTQHLIAEVPRRDSQVGMTIGIDLGDVWSHCCTLNEDGEVVDRGRFRTSPSGVETWFTDLPPVERIRALRQWGLHLASRGGKQTRNRAIVAVARKLAVLLHRIWITQEPYVLFHAVAA